VAPPRTRSGPLLALFGGLLLFGGAACVVAGVLFLVDRGGPLGYLAGALVVAGELLGFGVLAFSWAGVASWPCSASPC